MSGQLVEQWPVKPLSELCEDFKKDIVDGPFGSNLKREHYTEEGVPVLKIQNIKAFEIKLHKMDYVSEKKAEELKRHSFQKGDIIMTKLGNPLGVSAIVEELDEGIIVADLVRIRAQKINTKFLCYQLNSPKIKAHINSLQKGTTRPRVRITIVRDIPIVVPPMEEQERIVSILDKAFENTEDIRKGFAENRDNAEQLFKQYLANVFSQNGEEWIETSIGDACTLKSGNTVSKKLERTHGELPYVKVANMNDLGNEIEIVSSQRFLNNVDVRQSSILPIGTTIFPKRGGAIMTNKKRITSVPICCDLNIMGVIPSELLVPKFLYFYFLNIDMRKLGSGSTIPQINNYDIAPLPIAFPQQKELQQKIVYELEQLYSEVEKCDLLFECKINAINELKQSILQEAFNGTLRIAGGLADQS